MTTIIDDTKHLLLLKQLLNQLVVVTLAYVLDHNPFKALVQLDRIWGQFSDVFQTVFKAVFLLQRWLGGGTHHQTGSIVQRQLLDHGHARTQ